MRRVTRDNYHQDPCFRGVAAAVTELLADGDVVAPVEVMIRTGRLQRADYQSWRQGKLPYLERGVAGSLEKLSRVLRILAFHAESSGLRRSRTDYRRWGKGPSARLRFSRSGEAALEEAWSTCFVRPRAPEPCLSAEPWPTAENPDQEGGDGRGTRPDRS